MDRENNLKDKQRNIERKENRIREENRSKFMTIYWVYVFTRLMMNQILQCIYLILQRSSIKRNNNNETTSDENLKFVQKLMIFVGQIHRADGTTGVFFYAVTISIVFIFNLLGIMSNGKIFDVLTSNRMLLFLAEPEKEREIVIENLKIRLDQVINSNQNFVRQFFRTLIANQSVVKGGKTIKFSGGCGTERKQHSATGLSKIISSKDHIYYKRFLPNTCEFSLENISILINDQKFNNNNKQTTIDFDRLIALVKLIEALHRQRQYLIKLKSNTSIIWPPTRTIDWFYTLQKFGTHAYVHSSICTWFSGQIMAMTSFYMGYQTIVNSTAFEPEYRSYTLNERFLCAEYHFFTYMFMFSFIPTFCTYSMTLIYQLSHLKLLWPRMSSIYKRVEYCELWQYNSYRSLDDNFNSIEQTRKDLQFECDKKVIELYINYQIFRDENRLAIKIANTASNQIVSFIMLTLLPVLAFFRYVPGNHLTTLILIGLAVVMSANIPFLLCSYLTASCNKFAKSAWSLVAFAEGHNYRLYDHSKNYSRRLLTGSLPKKNHHRIDRNYSYLIGENSYGGKEGEDDDDFGRIPDYEYYSKSFISPHSVFLWRRLIEHHQTVSEDFVCKLFGIFRIDYTGVLKFNHWLVWVSILTALYR